MSASILAACSPGEVHVAALRDGRFVDYSIWRPGAPDGVGDLHRGRVMSRLPALGGAFVALDGEQGFLPDTEGAAHAAEGEIIGVRITRAAQSGKGPRLTARLAPAEMGQIGTGRPILLRRGPGAVEHIAQIHPDAIVFADDPKLVAELRPMLRDRIELSPTALWDDFLAGEIAALTDSWAMLPGGGRLSVHPTPALTAIDLDTGGYATTGVSKQVSQSAFNNAALPELARQIRLRNLGGAILVDWAGLSSKRRIALGPGLAAALASDPLRPRLLGFTALGLAEIVRPRVRPPLHEMLRGPHAAGLAGLRALVREVTINPGRSYTLRAAPPVVAALAADHCARMDVARLTGRELNLRSDPTLSAEAWAVESLRG